MQANFSQLETLELFHSGHNVTSVVLDLSSMQSLRQLTIEDWSPEAIKVSSNCKVHAVWRRLGWRKGQTRQWLQSPCWTTPDIKLASLVVEEAWVPHTTDLQVRHIHRIMECHGELEWLKISSQRLGSDEAPLTIPTQYIQGRNVSLSVNIWTAKG